MIQRWYLCQVNWENIPSQLEILMLMRTQLSSLRYNSQLCKLETFYIFLCNFYHHNLLLFPLKIFCCLSVIVKYYERLYYDQQINVGCRAISFSFSSVRLEFSRDFGATWHLLVPLCTGSPLPNSLCTNELHPASIYYPGTLQGWTRQVIHVGKLHLCGWVKQSKK